MVTAEDAGKTPIRSTFRARGATVFHTRSIGGLCVTNVTDIRNDPCNDTDIVVILTVPHKQVPKGAKRQLLTNQGKGATGFSGVWS